MNKLINIALVSVLLAVSVSALPKPQAPLALFAQDRIQALVRSQNLVVRRQTAHFRGQYAGVYTAMGTVGKYKGGFSGERQGRKVTGKFYGKCVGKTNSMGMTGSYTAGYKGQFGFKKLNKAIVGGFGGEFKWAIIGMHEGVKASAKADGTFRAKFFNSKVVVTEKAKFRMNIGGKHVRGIYFGKFNGKTFSAKMVGKAGGKKFSIKYEVTLDGSLASVSNKGRYTVWVNGNKFSGKYDSNDMMLPGQ